VETIEKLWNLTELSIVSSAIRVLFSMLAGIVIGWERGRKGRPAGIKTHSLVCMASALVMMTGQFIFNEFGGSNDVARLGAQVISGIGFLGAGTIILTGNNKVKGLTTAASIWCSACIGLAIGIGYVSGALLMLFGVLFIFIVISRVEELVNRHSKVMDIYFETNELHCIGEIIKTVKKQGCKINDVQVARQDKGYKKKIERGVSVLLNLYLKNSSQRNSILLFLSENPSVEMVEEV